MAIVILFAALTAVMSLIAVPLFEGVVAVAVVSPLIALVVGRGAQLVGVELASMARQPVLYGISMLLGVAASYASFGRQRERRKLEEFYALGVFAVIFSGAYYVCSHKWPDFFPLGERLRDYSLIVSAIHSPIIAQESWMEGTPLNYYIFWYRFAAMLHALTGMAVWNIYHATVALAVALYGAVCFQIIRVVFRAGVVAALVAALFIPFGSNVMGIMRMTRTEGGGWGPDSFWWGPSRVTRGAITEFPAWSFILGDAHPHYLNLVAIPFLFLILFRCIVQRASPLETTAQAIGVIVAGAMFLFGANAWEVPMWLGLSGAMVFVRFQREAVRSTVTFLQQPSLQRLLGAIRLLGNSILNSMRSRRVLLHLLVWGGLFLALELNSFHIIPEAGKLARVQDPIAVTTTKEFLYHWGAHAVVLVLGLCFLTPLRPAAFVMFGIGLLALFFDKAGALIILLLGSAMMQGVALSDDGGERDWANVCAYALVISGLGLVVIPELVFLDDAYGGPDERMNTIFKSYTTAWGLLGMGCMAVALRVWQHSEKIAAPYRLLQQGLLSLACVVYFVGTVYPYSSARFGFYGGVIRHRIMQHSSDYGAEGLGQVDRDKPGSAALIRILRDLPYGRVLEAQGNAYSYTTFVSTLSAQPSYLGWANHLHLLSKVAGEVGRREAVTSRMYGPSSCTDRLDLARSELIRYVVVGANERAQYPNLGAIDFDCFTKLADEGEYLLFEAR